MWGREVKEDEEEKENCFRIVGKILQYDLA